MAQPAHGQVSSWDYNGRGRDDSQVAAQGAGLTALINLAQQSAPGISQTKPRGSMSAPPAVADPLQPSTPQRPQSPHSGHSGPADDGASESHSAVLPRRYPPPSYPVHAPRHGRAEDLPSYEIQQAYPQDPRLPYQAASGMAPPQANRRSSRPPRNTGSRRRARAWATTDLPAVRDEPRSLPASAVDDLGRTRVAKRGNDDAALTVAVADIRRLSAGSVEKVLPSGPVLAPRRERRGLRKSTFGYVLGPRDRLVVASLSICWAACVVAFWAWWLEPSHRLGLFGLVANSAVLLYVSGYPIFFIIGVNRLRNARPSVSVPLLRTAFVVTRAPSEPWEVARDTLSAMLDQEFPLPYDVWLCDERPNAEIFEWCDANGVSLATRNGVERYHRETWPRRTRCKEGNLAYFYDNWGYRYYDVVAQLDCDHRPARTYLAEMVRPFADPGIGYVAAPSVCDANAEQSWAARGRLHKEASFHGPFQLGHSDGWGPLCIGSHYAVRTRALRDIGGIGPELAEDFSTSFLLNSAGWHGAFAINANAHGDGPNTFSAMVVQEFQWSRSLTTVLLGLVPRNLTTLPWRLRFRFLYALSYYILMVSTTAAGLALAPLAAVTGSPWINVNYLDFLLRWWSISIWLVLLTLLLKRRGLLRPSGAPIMSWENWLYTLSRWPYIARGIGAAVLQSIRPRPVTFKVTPKEAGGLEKLPAQLILPYVLISIGSAVAAIYGESTHYTAGYIFLSIVGGLIYFTVAAAVPCLHAVECARRAHVSIVRALWRTALSPLILAVFSLAFVTLAAVRYPDYLEHVVPSLLKPLSSWASRL